MCFRSPFAWILQLLPAWAVVLFTAAPAQADLLAYIRKPEPAYSWKLVSKNKLPLIGTVYQIELISQTWQDIVWKHDLAVVMPDGISPKSTMLLWNQGGKHSSASALMAADFARKMRAPVAFLYGIPNQPLLGNQKEDALITETFVRYLETRDANWPLLFPMVKSLIKAMDTLQAFSRQEWKHELKEFVVTGASKRGWTSWLTAATNDPRVKAIAPMVIDTLNMQKQMSYQLESYGAYSEQIRDYTRRKLVPPPRSPEAQKLWEMVDPWVYRDRIQLPKLIINGTNDPYWTQDALNLYWDDLKGDKWVCYVPNAGHDLAQQNEDGKKDRIRAINTLSAFARVQAEGRSLPRLNWKHEDNGSKYRLRVESDVVPKAVRLWFADAQTRDFRQSTWKSLPIEPNGKTLAAEISGPDKGCRVFYVECEYEQDRLNYFLSTQMRIVGTPVK